MLESPPHSRHITPMRNLVLLAAVLASLLPIRAEATSVDAESQTITIALAQEPHS